jgi:hypothetical protein
VTSVWLELLERSKLPELARHHHDGVF